VAETGCRAAYSAKKRPTSHKGRAVEAAVYRESCARIIAAVYHNSIRMFGANKFTLVPQNAYRGKLDVSKLEELQLLYCGARPADQPEYSTTVLNPIERRASERSAAASFKNVQAVCKSVRHLTYYQSEDPVWFLLRAFTFTSRTSHSFIRAVCRNFDIKIRALSLCLRGANLRESSRSLPTDLDADVWYCERTLVYAV